MEEIHDKWSVLLVLSNPLKCGISNQVHSVKWVLWSIRKLNTRFIIFSILSLHHSFLFSLTLSFHPLVKLTAGETTIYELSTGSPWEPNPSTHITHSLFSGTRFSPSLPSWKRPQPFLPHVFRFCFNWFCLNWVSIFHSISCFWKIAQRESKRKRIEAFFNRLYQNYLSKDSKRDFKG